MRMSEMMNLMAQAIEVCGDVEVTVCDEGTGEIRYVEGISFNGGDEVLLETVSYGEKQLIERIAEIGEEMEELSKEQFTLAMQLMGVVCL